MLLSIRDEFIFALQSHHILKEEILSEAKTYMEKNNKISIKMLRRIMTEAPYLMNNSSFEAFMESTRYLFSLDDEKKSINLNSLIKQILIFIEDEFRSVTVSIPTWEKIYSLDFSMLRRMYLERGAEQEEIIKKEIEYFLIKISECCDPEQVFKNNIDFKKLCELLAKIGVPINCKNGYFFYIDKLKKEKHTFIDYKVLIHNIQKASFYKKLTFLDRPLIKKLCQFSFNFDHRYDLIYKALFLNAGKSRACLKLSEYKNISMEFLHDILKTSFDFELSFEEITSIRQYLDSPNSIGILRFVKTIKELSQNEKFLLNISDNYVSICDSFILSDIIMNEIRYALYIGKKDVFLLEEKREETDKESIKYVLHLNLNYNFLTNLNENKYIYLEEINKSKALNSKEILEFLEYLLEMKQPNLGHLMKFDENNFPNLNEKGGNYKRYFAKFFYNNISPYLRKLKNDSMGLFRAVGFCLFEKLIKENKFAEFNYKLQELIITRNMEFSHTKPLLDFNSMISKSTNPRKMFYLLFSLFPHYEPLVTQVIFELINSYIQEFLNLYYKKEDPKKEDPKKESSKKENIMKFYNEQIANNKIESYLKEKGIDTRIGVILAKTISYTFNISIRFNFEEHMNEEDYLMSSSPNSTFKSPFDHKLLDASICLLFLDKNMYCIYQLDNNKSFENLCSHSEENLLLLFSKNVLKQKKLDKMEKEINSEENTQLLNKWLFDFNYKFIQKDHLS